MSFFKSPTPNYHGQGNPPQSYKPDWMDWFLQLFQTPTPQYREAPKGAIPHSTDPNTDR